MRLLCFPPRCYTGGGWLASTSRIEINPISAISIPSSSTSITLSGKPVASLSSDDMLLLRLGQLKTLRSLIIYLQPKPGGAEPSPTLPQGAAGGAAGRGEAALRSGKAA
eukprot:GHVT01092108.1.p1 GENE.GHVT01092108.1~~GHVT01092108.1.p1  ORF type:complete len:109 (-),score=12.06 GHVT01092108.1:100-426(-)